MIFDPMYILFMIPAYLFVLIVNVWLKSTVAKYSKIGTRFTGTDSAKLVLQRGGAMGVNVNPIGGELTDNYDPSTNVINLSQSVYGINSVAAVGIAAHEAGHALQYAENYGPAALRQSAVKICNIGSRLAIPLMLIGYIFSMPSLIYAGLIGFSLIVVFQLITLPVEFNASRRAVSILSESGALTEEELKGVKKVLTAAAMTYVGALAVTSMQLLYYFMRFSGRRR